MNILSSLFDTIFIDSNGNTRNSESMDGRSER